MSEEAELSEELRSSLTVRPGTIRVVSRESTRLEFKESFGFGSIAEYLRTMAAFANTHGGFLVFGVQDSPRDLIGIDGDQFDNLDVALFTTHINSNFSPAIDWTTGDIEVEGFRLGYIYAHPHQRKPVICIGDAAATLKEGDVYYRYRGQTRRIRAPELTAIFEERLEREREAWRQHLAKVAEAGPTNVAVLDLLTGRGDGVGGSFLIDDEMIDQLKFVREGRFSETGGAPTLRLIGEAQPVGVVGAARRVPVSIDFHDLVGRFLANSQLSEADASAYLKEALSQDSFYVPVHFFLAQSGLSRAEALQILSDLPSARYRDQMRARISGERQVAPAGAVAVALPTFIDLDAELLSRYRAAETQKAQRSLLLAALREDADAVEAIVEELEVSRLAEAVTHLERSQLDESGPVIRRMLQTKFVGGFDQFDGQTRTLFRKAVAHMDEQLYTSDG